MGGKRGCGGLGKGGETGVDWWGGGVVSLPVTLKMRRPVSCSQARGEDVSSDESAGEGSEGGVTKPRFRTDTASTTMSTDDDRLQAQTGALSTMGRRKSQELPSWQQSRLASASTASRSESKSGPAAAPKSLFKKKDAKAEQPTGGGAATSAQPAPKREVKSVFDDPSSVSSTDRFVMGTERPAYKTPEGPGTGPGTPRKRTLTDSVCRHSHPPYSNCLTATAREVS